MFFLISAIQIGKKKCTYVYDKEVEGAIWGMDTFIQVGRRRERG